MTTIKVPEETLIQVKNIAGHTGRSAHWIMLEAIKKYVTAMEQSIENEKAWLQSGIDALKNAEQYGYASTADELDAKIKHLKETEWKVGV